MSIYIHTKQTKCIKARILSIKNDDDGIDALERMLIEGYEIKGATTTANKTDRHCIERIEYTHHYTLVKNEYNAKKCLPIPQHMSNF